MERPGVTAAGLDVGQCPRHDRSDTRGGREGTQDPCRPLMFCAVANESFPSTSNAASFVTTRLYVAATAR